MDILRQASPTEWVSTAGFLRRSHGFAWHAVSYLIEAAQDGGTDLSARLLSCGLVDMAVAAVSAVEEVGADNVNGGVVIWGPMWALKSINGEALGQIEDKLRTVPSALRYVKESKVEAIPELGQTCGVFGTIVTANLYGKDEDNSFGFTREYCQASELQLRQQSHMFLTYFACLSFLTCGGVD